MHYNGIKNEFPSVSLRSILLHTGACSKHHNNSSGASFFPMNNGTHFISYFFNKSGIKFPVLRLK
jgi:hypothetical protein